MDRLFELLQAGAIQYGPGFAGAILTLGIGWLAARLLTRLLKRVLTAGKTDPTLIGFLAHLAYLALMALVVVSALTQLGVQTTSLVAVIGAAGLAIGFALQGSLANFAAGVILISLRPFRVGDSIETAGASGIVKEIQVFSTLITTADNRLIIVPNAAITANNIINGSAAATRRIDLTFGIGYQDDLQLAKRVLQDLLDRDRRVLKDPAPEIVLAQLADSCVKIGVRPWVKAADYSPVLYALTEAVKLEFDARGISIPYPQQDVHIHQAA